MKNASETTKILAQIELDKKQRLDKCQELFDKGDIDGANKIIRPLALFSCGGPHHSLICDLEEKIVDALIDRA